MVAPLRAGDPAHLGRFRLLGRIGAGGQGTVYLGEDRAGVRVAVKTLSSELVGDDVARRRFADEVALVRQVSSFCVAEVLDADLEGEQPYIVSEYVPGPSLSEAVATNGPLAPGATARLGVATVTALAAIHEAGIVHRDFKPQNVLLGPDGPRVIDFGIARAHGTALTTTGQIVGTIAYMSPEQIDGGRVGPASDMFSWAVTMAYAASGRRAFEAASVPALMHRILYTEPELPVLPDGLAVVLRSCLAKSHTARPTARDALLQLIAGSSADATRPVRTETPTRRGAEATATWRGTEPAPVDPGATLAATAEQAAAAGPTARTRRRWPWLAGIGVLTIAAVAAAVIAWPSIAPSTAAPPTAQVEGTLIFSDTFTDRSGWDGYNFNPDAAADQRTVRGHEVAKGVYSMQASSTAPDVAALSPTPPKQPSSAPGGERKVMITATAEIQDGSRAPGAVGLLCQWDEETPFGYQFLLGLDGAVQIQKIDRGNTRALASGMTSAPPIGRRFSLQAACRSSDSGTELRFWVDGAQLLTATDPTPLPTTGSISQVGFRVRITEGGANTLRVSWDDFALHRLE